MTASSLALGDRLPDLRLQSPSGGELPLSTFRGRPLVLVCVRYYG